MTTNFSFVRVINEKEVIRPKYKRPYPAVYTIRCLANGKRFIAFASDCDKRIRDHLVALRKGKHRNLALQKDFITYGEKRFAFKVLFKFKRNLLKDKNINQLKAMYNKELESWLKYYKSTDDRYGYNITPPVK